MRSKHCEFNGHGEGDDGEIQINISATEATSIIHGDDNDIDTLIQLEDYNGNDGWEVFCGMVTKYTVKLTLIKREK